RLIDGAMQGVEEPGQPLGDVHGPLLGALQNIVVGLALPLDLRRQAVEALRAAVGARQQQITVGPGDTAVAVVERVQGPEPQTGKPRLADRRLTRDRTGTFEDTACLCLQSIGGRRLEMRALAADGAGDHLHGATGVVAPTADLDPGEAGVTSGKERRVAAEQ